jgi:H+/Cl- antiporter ClcA
VLFALLGTLANMALQALLTLGWWVPFIIAPTGFATISWLTQNLFEGAEGSGIPQTIAALTHRSPAFREQLLSLRVALGKIMLTLLGLVSGASIGREGPTVQIGAAVMYALGRTERFPHEIMQRGLILAGGAAGVAAAFNAPLAGVVFAIEEMSRSFSQRTSGIVITAVILAGIVSLALLGDYAYFGHTNATLDVATAWLVVPIAGFTGGIAGGIFSRLIIEATGRLPGSLGLLRSSRPYVFAAACGLALAGLGYLSDNSIYGTGYAETRSILEGGATAQSFGLLKLAATVVSYISGIPGGIFSPSLAVGAGLGQNLAYFFPSAPIAAIVILGMVGYFSGVVQAPLTAFVIVVEMTRDSDMVLPLLAVSLIAAAFSRLVCPHAVYKALARRFRPQEESSTPPREV